MNTRNAIAAITAAGSLFAAGQNVSEEPMSDPVLDAIQEFNRNDREKANEVTVVLDDVGVSPAPDAIDDATDDATDDAPVATPVLVTGKPPADSITPEEMETVQAEPSEPDTGVAVRVESRNAGTGGIDPSSVKLLAPFPAKPRSLPPAGWRLDASDAAPPFTREVEIAPGSSITLTIRPHLLVPESDGANVFTIPEPGFDSALGYRQTATVGAILATSVRQLEEESIRLGSVIDGLQQLLISLPKPEPAPEEKPAKPRKK